MKSSGLVVESLEKSTKKNDEGSGSKDGMKKFNSPITGGSPDAIKRPTPNKEERKDTESIVEEEVPPAVEEEDYNDDFEQDSQKSGTKHL